MHKSVLNKLRNVEARLHCLAYKRPLTQDGMRNNKSNQLRDNCIPIGALSRNFPKSIDSSHDT